MKTFDNWDTWKQLIMGNIGNVEEAVSMRTAEKLETMEADRAMMEGCICW